MDGEKSDATECRSKAIPSNDKQNRVFDESHVVAVAATRGNMVAEDI